MLAKPSLRVTGPVKIYRSVADSGTAVHRGFCPDCGSSLLYGSATFPDAAFVTAGSLDDPTWFVPQMIVYISSAQPWDRLDPDLQRFDHMPPMRHST